MIPFTLNTSVHFANLMYAFRNYDLNKYLKELEYCKKYMSDDIYNFYYNLSKSSAFMRKGEYKI